MKQNQRRTWIELDKKAAWHNLDVLKSLSGTSRLGVVLKGNAYGHGMLEMASILQEHPAVDWLCVAGTDEALQLRHQGITKPLLAMSYCDSDPQEIVAHDISVGVYDYETVQRLDVAALQLNKPVRVHVKVDTNMCRLGVLPKDLPLFLKKLTYQDGVIIEGLFTHLSDINNPDLSFVLEQLRVFEKTITQAKMFCGDQLTCIHALACGALMFERKYDMVRVGTNVFGFWKSPLQLQRFSAINEHVSLMPVLTWKTKIVQIKEIPAGSYVGYNCSFYSDTQRTIAVVPIGYVDGYPRALSNKGCMVVRGVQVPVIGIISMNLTIIDVSDVVNVANGDEVVVLGGSHDAVSIPRIAEIAGTISNELVTRLNPEIPRIIIESLVKNS